MLHFECVWFGHYTVSHTKVKIFDINIWNNVLNNSLHNRIASALIINYGISITEIKKIIFETNIIYNTVY